MLLTLRPVDYWETGFYRGGSILLGRAYCDVCAYVLRYIHLCVCMFTYYSTRMCVHIRAAELPEIVEPLKNKQLRCTSPFV